MQFYFISDVIRDNRYFSYDLIRLGLNRKADNQFL